eukprot:TRINITY_DN9594_c0_g1_i1.p1 TRINITY_DN9594_c0_g1~~TRINITY_DN9594_c0_g1_i1.p1  ORF type:complete len:641 (+),score=65.24 TRINITY_DN9594_c0_g1_i1:138-2060(+)
MRKLLKNLIRTRRNCLGRQHRNSYSLQVELGGVLAYPGGPLSHNLNNVSSHESLMNTADSFSMGGNIEKVAECHKQLIERFESFTENPETKRLMAEQKMRAHISKGLHKEALEIFSTHFDGETVEVTETTLILVIDILRMTKASATDWVQYLELIQDIEPLTSRLIDALISSWWDQFPVSVWLLYVLKHIHRDKVTTSACFGLLMSVFRNPGVEKLLFKVLSNPSRQMNVFAPSDVIENIDRLIEEGGFTYSYPNQGMPDDPGHCIFEVANLPKISSKTPENELPLIEYLRNIIDKDKVAPEADHLPDRKVSLCLHSRASTLGGLVNRIFCEAHSFENLAGESHIILYEKCLTQLANWRLHADVIEVWNLFIHNSLLHKHNYPNSKTPLKLTEHLCVTALKSARLGGFTAAANRMITAIYFSDLRVNRRLLNAMLLATESTGQCLELFQSSRKSGDPLNEGTIYALLRHSYACRPQAVIPDPGLPSPDAADPPFIQPRVVAPQALTTEQIKTCFSADAVSKKHKTKPPGPMYHKGADKKGQFRNSDNDPFKLALETMNANSHLSLDFKCYSILIANYLCRFCLDEAVESAVQMITVCHFRPLFEDIGIWRDACSSCGLSYDDFKNGVNSKIPDKFENRRL